MSSNVVIVAIPDEKDHVWKISSEKVPHLTVLFLGEEDKVDNLDQIMLFVEHAADTTLRRFFLSVDRRGELGADQADVLFFKKNRYDFKAIRDFRSLLLKDPNIKTAYDSTTQFEAPKEVGVPGQPWIPHLTLGYPATPAKPDEQDFGFYSVDFNKLAVWTGDFEGPEFLLKDYGEEFDEMAIPMDVAMSDLQHYGVKGQRWGVRKQEVGSGGHIRISKRTNRALPSSPVTAGLVGTAVVMLPLTPAVFLSSRARAEIGAARSHNKRVEADKKWNKQIQSSKKAVEVHNKAADEVNKKLPDFNNDSRWKNADGTKIQLTSNPKKQQEYDRAAMDEVLNPAYAKAAIAVHGSQSPGGRYKFEIENASTGTMKVTDTLKEKQAAEHAATDDEVSVRFKINRDENGHILGFVPEETDTEMAQTAELGVEFLEHYGVKGMRWGHRKAQIGAGARAVGRGIGAVATFAGDVDFESQVESGRAREMVITKANPAFRRTDLPAVKARHGDYGKLRNRAKKPFAPEARAYRKDARETYIKRLETSANSIKNFSGDRQYTIRERGWELPEAGGALPKSKHYWDVSSRRVKHAATDTFTRLEIIEDSEGYITDLKKVEIEESMAQTVDLGAEFLAHLSEEPWSNFTKADYTPEQWHAACLIHTHEGEPTSKSECKLPVKTPDGALNRNGVHAAAAALAGARGGLKGVSDDQKKKAGNALKRYYAQLDEEPPESLAQSVADVGAAFVLEHYGVKGMRWGHRKPPPQAVRPSATSVVPRGTRRKTKIKVAGGENHPAHDDAVKVAQAKAKMQKSGTSALSNRELQELQNRLNLERNVKQLVGSTTTTGRGRKFVKGLTGFNKEVNEAVGTGLQTERLYKQAKNR
jgi:hypothetical protein